MNKPQPSEVKNAVTMQTNNILYYYYCKMYIILHSSFSISKSENFESVTLTFLLIKGVCILTI